MNKDGTQPEQAEADTPTSTPTPTPERRRFLALLSIALGGFGAVIVGIPVLGSLLEPLLLPRLKTAVWRRVGKVSDFQIGRTVLVTYLNAVPLPWTGVTARTGAWLRREDAHTFSALSVYCQHLGCPVRWDSQAALFLCPCHGGVYYANGAVAAGPPPRPLQACPVRVRGDEVEIQATGIPLTY